MKSFFLHLKAALFKFLQFFKAVLTKIFGSVNYAAPPWIQWISKTCGNSILGQKFRQFQVWKQAYPLVFRKRLIIGISAAVIIITAGVGMKWYIDSLPVPDYVKITTRSPEPTNPEYKSVYEAYIDFSKSVIRPEQLNKPVVEGISMEPKMVGTWTWKSDKVLAFMPDISKNDWPAGTKYTVKFDKKLFASHLIFDSYKTEFSTKPLTIRFTKDDFYIDPRNSDIKRVVATLRANYPIDIEDFKKRVQFNLENHGLILTTKKMPFTFTTNPYHTEIYVQSESLPIPRDPQTMVISFDKGAKAKVGGASSEDASDKRVSVPTIFDGFGIESSEIIFARNEKFEPEQIVVVHTKLEARSEDVAAKLELYTLPKDRAASSGSKLLKDYGWASIGEITPDLLKQSTKVYFKLVPSELEQTKTHTFKVELEPNRWVYQKIGKGLKALGGYELKDNFERTFQVPEYPHELSIMSQGAILSLSGDLKLPLLARNIGKVKYKMQRIVPEQVNHLLFQMQGNVTQLELPYGLDTQITESFEVEQTLKIETARATQYFSFDLQPFLNKSSAQKGIFLFEVRGENTEASDRRLIMITDLGILVKETNAKNSEVFVQNFRTGLPVSGALVEVVGKNGLTVLSATTDSNGRVTFPELKEFKNEKEPIAFSVKKDHDQAFLPYQNSTRNLHYSRFDVGGLYDDSKSDQLMAMMFSDRGIYRPGETAHFGFIVRAKKGSISNAKPNLEWVVTDPRGTQVAKDRVPASSKDLQDFEFKTDDTAATGTYTAQLFLIKTDRHNERELLSTETIRVEEFQPDRMKISTRLEEEKLQGWIKPRELKAFVSLKNMFGTAAENRKVLAEVVLSPTSPSFKQYQEYTFTDLNPGNEQVFSERLGEQESDSKGEVEFDLDLTKYEANLFRLNFNTEGYESEGGRSVKASSQVLVSPLDYILGSKPDGDLRYISKDAARNLDVIAVDSDLKMTAAGKITLVKVERKQVSVLTKDSDGTYKYQSVSKETVLSEKPFKVDKKGTSIKLESDVPGDFTLVFKNENKVELLKVNYTIVGESNLAKTLDRNAELQISLNKADFKNGEEIQMQIKAPYTGAGLITIERDGVYSAKWFKTNTTTSVQTIKVPEGLDGNAYVNVTFLRAIDSSEIYASPLSYAVAPFSISLDEHKTEIKLNSPTLVKPGQKLNIQYSANKATQIILYGVDEGILQVARYKMPNPLGYFFQKRALQVKTYQMLDLLLPEFSVLKDMQAAGGDEGFGAIGKNLNPFKSKRIKPVAFWSGVLQADASAKTYTFEVPDSFNGNLKIMAISAGKEGLGSIQGESLVRGDLIISPNVPMFVAPQDEFIVGVSVANQTEGSGANAKVKLETSGNKHFNVVEGKTLNLDIPEGRESSGEVKVKTQEQLGVGHLEFQASLGKAKARLKMEVSVRPSTPYLNFLQTGIIKGSTVTLKNSRQLYSEYGDVKVQGSASPFIVATGLFSYLEGYPYGCTEQAISRAVPMLVVRSMKEYMGDEAKLKETFSQMLQLLNSRQRSDGGFALYSPVFERQSQVDVSIYAAHYLVEAKAKGLTVSDGMIERVNVYLQSSTVRGKTENIEDARRWAYSLYVMARLGVVNGASLAELRRELDKNHKDQWQKDVVALFMAGTYALYKNEEAGEKLIRGFKFTDENTGLRSGYLDALSRNAIGLFMAGKHYPGYVKKLVTEENMAMLMKPLNAGRYHTNSVGWLLMAFDAMAHLAEAKASLTSLKLEIRKAEGFAAQNPTGTELKTWKLGLGVADMKLSSEGSSPLFYSFKSSGFDRVITPIKKGIEVSRQYRDQDGKEIKSIKIGEEVTVHVQARSLDGEEYHNIALVDLIPSGFEMILSQAPMPSSDSYGEESEESGDSGESGDEGEREAPSDEGNGEGDYGFWRNILMSKVFAQSSTSLGELQTDFVDNREDRVIIYATINGDLREYTYKIKAVNKGKFVTAPAFAEGMYNRDLQFIGNASTIEVTN